MILALWVAFAVLALLDLWAKARPHAALERIVKPGAMLCLLAIALLSGSLGSAVGLALVVALALCLLGDVLLLGTSDARFLGGLGAFLLGHLAYAVGFLLVGPAGPRWAVIPAVALAVLLPFAARIVSGAARSGGTPMGGAVAAYIAVIAAMAVLAWMTGHALLGVGALVFVLSDTVLGHDRFVRPLRWAGVAVMATYLLAQAILTATLLTLLPS